jgi:hypothetical protein
MDMQTGFTAEEARLILEGSDDEWTHFILWHPYAMPHLEPYIRRFPNAGHLYSWITARWPGSASEIAPSPITVAQYAAEILRK